MRHISTDKVHIVIGSLTMHPHTQKIINNLPRQYRDDAAQEYVLAELQGKSGRKRVETYIRQQNEWTKRRRSLPDD